MKKDFKLLAEEMDLVISDFKAKNKLTDEEIIRLLIGHIDFKVNAMGDIEAKFKDILNELDYDYNNIG